jgi:precorrin-6B methylase 2
MKWTAQDVLEAARGYQAAAVITAAADLELFDVLAEAPLAAADLARRLGCDLRGLTVLLDALTSLELLEKEKDRYSLADGVKACLTATGPQTVLAMAQHQGTCLRRWAQLARVVKTGSSAEPMAGVRGEKGDTEAFIGAMHNVSAPVAEKVVADIQPLRFRHLLDVGGASGTWTLAFLRACPTGRATLFDLPEVIPLARRRLAPERDGQRVTLVAGDYMNDTLPGGADLVWVSAIVHQNSREANRQLFRKAFEALEPGGRILIRDIIMEPSRTSPQAGALFAVNMLVGTEGGSTFTFEELKEDLEAAGFARVAVARQAEDMSSVLSAVKD